MPEVSRKAYQFGTKPGNIKTMPLLWISFLTGEKTDRSTSVFNGGMGGVGMSTLHILINPEKAHIVNAVKDHVLDPKTGLKRYIRHHQEQEGRALARVIVKQGSPVKVIQAGEEKI